MKSLFCIDLININYILLINNDHIKKRFYCWMNKIALMNLNMLIKICTIREYNFVLYWWIMFEEMLKNNSWKILAKELYSKIVSKNWQTIFRLVWFHRSLEKFINHSSNENIFLKIWHQIFSNKLSSTNSFLFLWFWVLFES
jgi:hypothetical protein